MKLLLVFNPHAGGGRAARLLPAVEEALRRFAEVTVSPTADAGCARRLVAESGAGAFDGVIAAGGDGTLFEVLNGLFDRGPGSGLPLGVIPIGTGNAFARDLGLQPGDWQKAVSIIARRRLRRVDVGRAEPDAGAPFHFLNIIGAGLPVDAMRTAERLKFIGGAAYSVAALWRALQLRSYPLEIELDGERIRQDALFVECSNSRYTGSSFLMAPAAELDDGLFDVTLVRRLPRMRLLRLFPTIYSGRHVAFDEVLTVRARRLRLLAPPGLELAADGEFRGTTPVTVTCLPGVLEIFS